ncbi:hypothetical protein V5799_015506 [Amblyomma americanum]|uniref:Uncharacterized protein n=1 Tax=Amblyomma americanum TaxID=6943 RepID=A0AAQ4F7U0_AMBAM
MDVAWRARGLRDLLPVNVTLVLVAFVVVSLVALAWSHVAMLVRAWKMLRKVPGPPDWLPMAYVAGAKNAVSNQSSTPEEFKLRKPASIMSNPAVPWLSLNTSQTAKRRMRTIT